MCENEHCEHGEPAIETSRLERARTRSGALAMELAADANDTLPFVAAGAVCGCGSCPACLTAFAAAGFRALASVRRVFRRDRAEEPGLEQAAPDAFPQEA